MKKLSLFIFLSLIFGNFGFAQNFTYHCKINTQFMNQGEKNWRNKYINYSFNSTDNKTISIFDHEIEVTYQKKLNILQNDFRLFAMADYSASEMNIITTLVIDKQTNFATYSVSYTGGESGQYGIGKCKSQ